MTELDEGVKCLGGGVRLAQHAIQVDWLDACIFSTDQILLLEIVLFVDLSAPPGAIGPILGPILFAVKCKLLKRNVCFYPRPRRVKVRSILQHRNIFNTNRPVIQLFIFSNCKGSE